MPAAGVWIREAAAGAQAFSAAGQCRDLGSAQIVAELAHQLAFLNFVEFALCWE
jgi:hypothetical protein